MTLMKAFFVGVASPELYNRWRGVVGNGNPLVARILRNLSISCFMLATFVFLLTSSTSAQPLTMTEHFFTFVLFLFLSVGVLFGGIYSMGSERFADIRFLRDCKKLRTVLNNHYPGLWDNAALEERAEYVLRQYAALIPLAWEKFGPMSEQLWNRQQQFKKTHEFLQRFHLVDEDMQIYFKSELAEAHPVPVDAPEGP